MWHEIGLFNLVSKSTLEGGIEKNIYVFTKEDVFAKTFS